MSTTRQRFRPSHPGIVFGALVVVLLVLIATFALVARQPPPPTISEFAPQSVEQIQDSPDDQGSSVGAGVGSTPSPSPLPAGETPIPRTRKCVGDPPRQTEDPQSPPCVPGWSGNNGGATYKGVTANEIRVMLPGEKSMDLRQIDAFERFFNKRFEFYGRSLNLIPVITAGNFTTCANMRADAVRADEELKVFASSYYDAQAGQETCFYEELSRRGIVSSQSSFMGTAASFESELAATKYQWSYYPALDTVLRNAGELLCKQFAGRMASYARPPLNARQRTFGIVVSDYNAGAKLPDPEPLVAAGRACPVPMNWKVLRVDMGPDSKNPDAAKLAISRMQGEDVTSLACLCMFTGVQSLMQHATSASYFPEWFVQNFSKQDDDHAALNYPGDHATQTFGIRSLNKALPRELMPYWNAQREVDPTIPPNIQNYSNHYWSLLLLASGIQAAGPRLTPETFESGLQRTRFPNPACGGPPHYQACVGFGGGVATNRIDGPKDHSMVNDFALIWWSSQGQSYEYDPQLDSNAYYKTVGRGLFCYANLGQRYGTGQWPEDSTPLFTGTCR